MSIAEDITVSIVLADFANEDSGKKINMLGAGWSVTSVQPTGLTPEAAVVVLMQIPAKYRGQDFAASLTLCDQWGEPVTFPSPTGQPTRLRVQQLVTVDPPMLPGLALLASVPSSAHIVMRLGNGLPLPPNQLYTWVFEIDGNKRASLSFFVAGPRPGPVIG